MPLTLAKKKELVEEIAKNLEENKCCLLVNVIGMTVSEVEDLRTKLRKKNVHIKVYKNRLIRKALEGKPEEGRLSELTKHLRGSTAMAFTSGDPIATAKVFVDYASDNEKLQLKAGVYEDQYWGESDLRTIAKLGSMAAVYGRLIMQMKAPMYRLVQALKWPSTKLVLDLKSVAEKSGE